MTEQPGKRVIARVVQPRKRATSNMERVSYCNVFSVRATPDEVVLNFGFDEGKALASKTARRVPVRHKIVFNVATARRFGKALEAALQQPAERQRRVSVQIKPAKKLN